MLETKSENLETLAVMRDLMDTILDAYREHLIDADEAKRHIISYTDVIQKILAYQ